MWNSITLLNIYTQYTYTLLNRITYSPTEQQALIYTHYRVLFELLVLLDDDDEEEEEVVVI